MRIFKTDLRSVFSLAALIAGAVAATLGSAACERGPIRIGRQPAAPKPGSLTGIINGSTATGSEPWAKSVAGLAFSKDDKLVIYCTGAILNANFILTAAHCLQNVAPPIYAVFGLAEGPALTARLITNRVVNEKFDPSLPDNVHDLYDVGLARIEGGLPDGFQPARLIGDDSALGDGAEILVAGYGISNLGGGSDSAPSGGGVLRFTRVKIQDIHYGRIEAATDEVKTGTCDGDSGGPALSETPEGFVLWGLTSRGDMNCDKQGVYTRVSQVRDWIDAHSSGAWSGALFHIP